ncbi:MAG: CocE/NonD family hydrolase [Ferruginibacter sp.]
MRIKNIILTTLLFFCQYVYAQNKTVGYVKENYKKIDTLIPMRDGIKLYTVIYVPKDNSRPYPFLIERTPYSAGPYGDTTYPGRIGTNIALMNEKYIFVKQDVRGRYMSEGINLEVTPHIAKKQSKKDVDESSDTYDTIEWLLKNIKNNNGKAGIYGISYPGFYATASLPGAHPALKAVSPQAPVTDEFIGDDANHNGAFFLMDNFNFMNYFGKARNAPLEDYGSEVFEIKYPDAYAFFLKVGSLQNTQDQKYFNKNSYIWDEYLQHDTYDDYWRSRNIRTHLKNINIPTLVVGGWFDAENLFGALRTYEAIEFQSPQNKTKLVMGPWTHGSWAGSDWSKFAGQEFGSNTSKYFQDSIETLFFNYYLKDKGNFTAAEATVFETGSNTWKNYSSWPPSTVTSVPYYFNAKGALSNQKEKAAESFDEYLSDPNKPVPYTNGIYSRRNNEYMAEDQRFASMRPDVLVYQTNELTADITLSGKIEADLFVSTSGTDADFVIKLIDVLPDTMINKGTRGMQTGGTQRMVRADIMRGKFRNSFEKPEPFVRDKITNIKFSINDVAHTFKKGHNIMIQMQSSWFPLVDRNPQKFMRIAEAKDPDFQKATIRIYHSGANSSRVLLPVIK